MNHKCQYCGKALNKSVGEINRARKMGLKLYCNLQCSGKAHRLNKSQQQLKDEKWWYDAFNREFMRDVIKEKKAAAFKKDYAANPEKYRKERQRRKEYHNEYCRSPAYREKKQSYDQKYCAIKKYGEYAESALIIREIEKLIDKNQSRQDRNCHNKTQQRKRLWKSSMRLT